MHILTCFFLYFQDISSLMVRGVRKVSLHSFEIRSGYLRTRHAC